MTLKLYMHPLASFCQKALIALYENATPFTPHLVDLSDAAARAAFLAIWPVGKFPVLHDEATQHLYPESTIIIEYLAQYHPGPTQLIPSDPALALETRLRDRFYDLYVNVPLQNIVADKLRPAESKDPLGVKQARTALSVAYGIIETEMATKTWAVGEMFTMADCAAAPALFYADLVQPLAPTYKNAAAYLQRLKARPSFARVIKEAEPYFANFPG